MTNRDTAVNKFLCLFKATHERNNSCHNYTYGEMSIEAHMSTLVDYRDGWKNAVEQSYPTGKNWILHSAHTDIRMESKVKIRYKQIDGVTCK